jgi:hypothetical protein
MHANTHVHTHVFLLTFRAGIPAKMVVVIGDVASQLSGYLVSNFGRHMQVIGQNGGCYR